jgi:Fe-S-cluster-containing hydrogenase component 2
MTYAISDQCIACEKCLPHLPIGAIKKNNNGKFSIDPPLYNNCIDSYRLAESNAPCSVFNGCFPTISSLIKSSQKTTNNYWDNWFVTYDRLISGLKAKKETRYWQRWFETYSRKLELLFDINHI